MAHVQRVVDDAQVDARLGLSTDPPLPAEVDSPWYRAIARSVREEYRDAVVVAALLFAGTDERLSVAGYAGGIKILARMMQHMGTAAGDG